MDAIVLVRRAVVPVHGAVVVPALAAAALLVPARVVTPNLVPSLVIVPSRVTSPALVHDQTNRAHVGVTQSHDLAADHVPEAKLKSVVAAAADRVS